MRISVLVVSWLILRRLRRTKTTPMQFFTLSCHVLEAQHFVLVLPTPSTSSQWGNLSPLRSPEGGLAGLMGRLSTDERMLDLQYIM